jgi:CD2 antigen cytoplasmic tail-binding protein 2
MSSRYSAAKPKRAGESYARAHHGEADDNGPSKKVKFDVRNPSALAPDAREDDDVLDADVIGGATRGATKRGAVNIDGYDSDSDNEAFDARAEARGTKGKSKGGEDEVDLAAQLDNYNARLKGNGSANAGGDADDDEDDDMFAMADDDDAEDGSRPDQAASASKSKDRKAVRFLDQKDIEGQEKSSMSGGRVTLDDDESSDEEEAELVIQEEGVDEEVGAGGLKKHAPRIDAFNMRQENEEGAFDEAGNFVRKAVDPDAVHDKWMEGLGKKEIKKAAAAHEKREEDMR